MGRSAYWAKARVNHSRARQKSHPISQVGLREGRSSTCQRTARPDKSTPVERRGRKAKEPSTRVSLFARAGPPVRMGASIRAARTVITIFSRREMLARIRKSLENREEGFTLIELLVVMVIIGILAAIAIPSFLAQRDKGYQS